MDNEELEIRNIMQGLEEFATFMSFQGHSHGLRILSVESVEQDLELEQAKQSADVLDMQKHVSKRNAEKQQTIHKSLSFTAKQISN